MKLNDNDVWWLCYSFEQALRQLDVITRSSSMITNALYMNWAKGRYDDE